MTPVEIKRRTKSNLIGKQFGRLTVIERTFSKKSDAYWWCRCACGVEKAVTSSALRSGKIVSCGCVQKSCRCKRPFESLFVIVKHNAVNQNRECTLTYEEFSEFTKILQCHYCTSNLIWQPYASRAGSRRYNLDRKDNRRGYSKDNCVACCWRCNSARGNRFTYNQWVEMTKGFRSGNLLLEDN